MPEVLQIVADKVKQGEWEKLANYIGITKSIVEKIIIESDTTKGRMVMCFEQINDNITWKFLKIQLKKINRFDIIANIRNETLLTIGKYIYFPSIIYIFFFFTQTKGN